MLRYPGRVWMLVWVGVLALGLRAFAGEFHYTVVTDKGFDEALASVQSAARSQGFKVPGVHTLPAGYDYVVVEVCDPADAKRLLARDPALGLLLPCCTIGVYTNPAVDGRTRISLLLPSALTRVNPSTEVSELAAALKPRLMKVVEEAR